MNGPASCGAKHPEISRNGAKCPNSFQVAVISASAPQKLPIRMMRFGRVGPCLFRGYFRGLLGTRVDNLEIGR